MIAQRFPFPLAGVSALVVATATLVAEAALLVAPHGTFAPYDPADSGAAQNRATAARLERLKRFEWGICVLAVGSASAGWAAQAATRRGDANRFLAGVAGVCCLGSVLLWLGLGARCLDDEWDANSSKPALVIEYDD